MVRADATLGQLAQESLVADLQYTCRLGPVPANSFQHFQQGRTLGIAGCTTRDGLEPAPSGERAISLPGGRARWETKRCFARHEGLAQKAAAHHDKSTDGILGVELPGHCPARSAR